MDNIKTSIGAEDGRNISSESSCYIYFITCLLSCFNLSNKVLELYSFFYRLYLVKVVVQLKLAMINNPNIDIIINI